MPGLFLLRQNVILRAHLIYHIYYVVVGNLASNRGGTIMTHNDPHECKDPFSCQAYVSPLDDKTVDKIAHKVTEKVLHELGKRKKGSEIAYACNPNAPAQFKCGDYTCENPHQCTSTKFSTSYA